MTPSRAASDRPPPRADCTSPFAVSPNRDAARARTRLAPRSLEPSFRRWLVTATSLQPIRPERTGARRILVSGRCRTASEHPTSAADDCAEVDCAEDGGDDGATNRLLEERGPKGLTVAKERDG